MNRSKDIVTNNPTGGESDLLRFSFIPPVCGVFSLEKKMKRCSHCGRDLPIEQFHKNRSSKDGLQSECKYCHGTRTELYIKRNSAKAKRIRQKSISKQKGGDWMNYPLKKVYHTDKYMSVYCPVYPKTNSGGCVHYHRLLMARHLGRVLLQDELVHHIDGDKTNNVISNLEITTRTKHTKHHGLGATIGRNRK